MPLTSVRLFYDTACVSGWPIRTLLDNVRGNPDVIPQIYSFSWGYLDSHGFLGPPVFTS